LHTYRKVAVPVTVTVVAGYVPETLTAKPTWRVDPFWKLVFPSFRSIEPMPVQTVHAATAPKLRMETRQSATGMATAHHATRPPSRPLA
jgi:hypothetical protein